MATPRETEERLRTWTQSQADRERLCAALLELDQRFQDVKPRRPKGGPDGARDIEAKYEGRVVWGAVGFRNNAIDSKEDKQWVATKFRSDLDAALVESPGLHGFVFLTNVDLTPAEREVLESYARSKVAFCEIFYRERIRLVLDSPKGFAYRYQFLGLTMSDPEQVSFFAEYGDRLLGFVQGRFDEVDARLARLEFVNTTDENFSILSLS
jgi:hypothetical protein